MGAVVSVEDKLAPTLHKDWTFLMWNEKWHLDGTNLAAMRRKALRRGGRAVECGGLERREEPYRLVPICTDEARPVRVFRLRCVG